MILRSFGLSVSRLTNERGNRCRPNLVGMGNGHRPGNG